MDMILTIFQLCIEDNRLALFYIALMHWKSALTSMSDAHLSIDNQTSISPWVHTNKHTGYFDMFLLNLVLAGVELAFFIVMDGIIVFWN